RPDSFHDAGGSPATGREGITFEADVDVTEWLGEVLYAYVPFETHEAVQDKLEELERDLDGEGMRSQLVVALDSLSRLIPGDTARLWFDPASIHVFDPETGDNLTRDEAEAEEIEEEAKKLRRRALERAQRAAEKTTTTPA